LLWLAGPSFLSKRSVLDAPLFGTICRALQVVGVDRVSKDDKGQSKIEMMKLIQDPKNPPILIFPEGTTTRSDTLMKFKPGAFIFQIPVQPILLAYHWHYFDPSNTATTPPLLWLFQLLTQLYINVSVEFLPISEPGDLESTNALVFASTVHDKMFSSMKHRSRKPVYSCDQTVDDFLVWKQFNLAKVRDPKPALLTLSLAQLRSTISLATPASRQTVSLTMVQACAKRYLVMLGQNENPLISLDKLASWIVPATPLGKEMIFTSAFSQAMVFPCVDRDALDMRSFAAGLIYLSPLLCVWGPGNMPAYSGEDESARKWGKIRAKMAFALAASEKKRPDEMVSAAFLGEFFGLLSEARIVLGEAADKLYDLIEFRDVVLQALVGKPSPDDATTEDLEALQEENSKRRSAGHALLDAAWRIIDQRFMSKSGGIPFFLSDQEVGAKNGGLA